MPEKLKTELGIDDILRPDMTELCDDYIERVILPDGMQKIGRLCFYNCSRLSVLELPSDICDVDELHKTLYACDERLTEG